MSSPYYYRISEIARLSNKYPYWKLHQLGQFSLNMRTNDILIELWLAPLTNREAYTNPENHKELVDNNNYNFSQSVRIKLDIGQLPILIPGTIFYNGYPIDFPNYFKRTFKFTPTESNQKIVPMGSAWGTWKGRSRFYTPYPQHQIFFPQKWEKYKPSEAYQAQLLVIDFDDATKISEISLDEYPLNQKNWFSERDVRLDNNGRKPSEGIRKIDGLIIPCIELVRFYMTYSSQSCQQLLMGGMVGEPNRLFIKDQTIRPDSNGEGGFLMLSKFICDEDRDVLIRPAFEDYAFTEFNRPYLSSVQNKMESGLLIPEARFPFKNEETELTVYGTYIQSGNRIYFLVYRLHYCTAQIDYKDAKFYRQNPAKKDSPESFDGVTQDVGILDDKGNNILGGTFDPVSDKKKHIRTGKKTGGRSQSTDAPSKYRKKFMLNFNHSRRFEHTVENAIEEQKPKTGKQKSSKEDKFDHFYIPDPGEENISTASPDGTDQTTPFGIMPKSEKDYDSPIDFDYIRDLVQPSEEDMKPEINTDGDDSHLDQNGKYLPIDFDIFLESLQLINDQNENLEVKCIYLPTTGDYYMINTPSKFPSVYENQDIKRKKSSPTEVFLAEIKLGEKYAYYLDIESVRKRSYKMLLITKFPKKDTINPETLRDILRSCEQSNWVWMKGWDAVQNDALIEENKSQDNVPSEQNPRTDIVTSEYEGEKPLPLPRDKNDLGQQIGFKYKSYLHTGVTAKDYADKIMNGLEDLIWLDDGVKTEQS